MAFFLPLAITNPIKYELASNSSFKISKLDMTSLTKDLNLKDEQTNRQTFERRVEHWYESYGNFS